MNVFWWEYQNKNPYPCRNHTFPNEVHHHCMGSMRLSAFLVLMMHLVGKYAISAWVWVLAFIAWPERNIKAAMWKSHISAHPFSWIVSWDNGIFNWHLPHHPAQVEADMMIPGTPWRQVQMNLAENGSFWTYRTSRYIVCGYVLRCLPRSTFIHVCLTLGKAH